MQGRRAALWALCGLQEGHRAQNGGMAPPGRTWSSLGPQEGPPAQSGDGTTVSGVCPGADAGGSASFPGGPLPTFLGRGLVQGFPQLQELPAPISLPLPVPPWGSLLSRGGTAWLGEGQSWGRWGPARPRPPRADTWQSVQQEPPPLEDRVAEKSTENQY